MSVFAHLDVKSKLSEFSMQWAQIWYHSDLSCGPQKSEKNLPEFVRVQNRTVWLRKCKSSPEHQTKLYQDGDITDRTIQRTPKVSSQSGFACLVRKPCVSSLRIRYQIVKIPSESSAPAMSKTYTQKASKNAFLAPKITKDKYRACVQKCSKMNI